MPTLNYSSGPFLPGTAADGGGSDVAWTNPNNAKVTDNTTTDNIWPSGGLRSNELLLSNFGFNLPDSAVVDGILVEVKRYGIQAVDSVVKLMKGGVATGDDKATTSGYPFIYEVKAYGGAEDLWGTTWTVAEINNSGFGVTLSAMNISGSGSANIDSVQITVYWHYDFTVAPADVPIRHVYKMFTNDGRYLGNLPKVTSKFALQEEANNIGCSINIDVAVFPDVSRQPTEPILTEAGDPILTEDDLPLLTEGAVPVFLPGDQTDQDVLIRNGNRVQVYEYNYYYPNGKLMFSGQVNKLTARYGSNSSGIQMLAYSDGLDLNSYIARGASANYTLDQSQLTEDSFDIVNSSGGAWSRAGQSVAVGSTNIAAVALKLNGSANVTVTLYDTANGTAIDSTTKTVSTSGAEEVLFGFPSSHDGSSFFFTIAVGSGQSIYVSLSSTNVYGAGSLYSAVFGGGSGGGVYSANTGDLWFKTYSGDKSTSASFFLKEPVTEMLAPTIDDYNLRGGRVTYTEDSIEATDLSLKYYLNTNTVLDVIKAVKDMCPSGYYYRADPGTSILDMKHISETPDFTLVKGHHISSLDLSLSIENVVNDVLFTGGQTSGVNLYSEYTSGSSIARYGLRLKQKTDNRVTHPQTADAMGLSILEEFQEEQNQTTVTVLARDMDITLLTPGKVIGFAGFGSFIDQLQLMIVRRDYHVTYVTLELGALPPRLTPTIERMTKELLAQQTIDNPSSPT